MIIHAPQVDFLGDSALLARFEGDDPLAVNARVHALAATVRAASLPGVLDVVPGMRDLVVHVAPLVADVVAVLAILEATSTVGVPAVDEAVIHVPVTYGGVAGPDLDDVASRCGLHVDDVCQRHAAGQYVVCFVGFLPGFPYLGLLDASLRLPRRDAPRPVVPPGAVAIAGEYTGIYPSASPGGWHLIGHTALTLFDPGRERPAVFTPGARVRFVPQ